MSTSARYKILSSTGGNVTANPGVITGIFVSAASATPTITIYDDPGTGTGVTFVQVFTPTSATYYPVRGKYGQGLNVVLGGTVTCTVFYDDNTGV